MVGTHGGTYGGNPIGCASALATIEVLTAPGFLDNVHARGNQLIDELRENYTIAIVTVRGTIEIKPRITERRRKIIINETTANDPKSALRIPYTIFFCQITLI